jgi:hypothetical protein
MAGPVIIFRSTLLLFLFAPVFAGLANAQIVFEEVSEAVGILYSGQSFGASWGDFNGDSRPDLWVGSHGGVPRLYVGTTEGQFALVSGLDAYRADNHGAAWADYDNDGDQDLLIVNGAQSGQGSGPNFLLVNELGQFTEKAEEFGLDTPLGRGRTPTWFDWNNDGRLDVFLANEPRPDGQAPSSLLTRRGDSFVVENDVAGITTAGNNDFAQIGWSHSIDLPVLMIHAVQYPEALLRFDNVPFVPVVEQFGFPLLKKARDVAFRDFDGDGQEDFFVLEAATTRGAVVADGRISGTLNGLGEKVGVRFTGGGSRIQLFFNPRSLVLPSRIFVGSAGAYPTGAAFTDDGTTFELSVDDVGHHHIAPSAVTDSFAIYVGYTPDLGSWTILASRSTFFNINYVVQGEQAITSSTNINLVTTDGAKPDSLLLNTNGQLIDATVSAGLDSPTACDAVAAADFDNDMDIDIYQVCRGIVGNSSNRLLVNNGDRTFSLAAGAAGAAGSMLGRGESVAVADYDQDGFIDIFVTNGYGGLPFGVGPDQLFRNLGNDNSWLEIDLTGIESNRDGIGARIGVLAGGVTQVRLADGGMHRFSQDHARLHFGLLDNQIVDEIVVNWPSGSRQVLTNLAVNQIIDVVECIGPVAVEDTLVTDRGVAATIDLLANDACLGNLDSDADGIPDTLDNCSAEANPDQLDTNGDGYGNVCDGDLNQDNFVNSLDLGLFKERFFTADPDADLNGDGFVNSLDLGLFKSMFFAPPGPSGVAP